MNPSGRWNTVGEPHFSSFHEFSGISRRMLKPVFGLSFDSNLEYAVTSEQRYFHSNSRQQQRCTEERWYFDHHLKCFTSVFFHAQLITKVLLQANQSCLTTVPIRWVMQSLRERGLISLLNMIFPVCILPSVTLGSLIFSLLRVNLKQNTGAV